MFDFNGVSLGIKNKIEKEKIVKYLDITKRAILKAKIIAPERSFNKKIADDFMGMVNAYFSDANHFFLNNDYVNAFACVNYAHGWLDAGARLGLFDVSENDKLFTLAE